MLDLDTIRWAFEEEVDMTLIRNDADKVETIFLVQRRGLRDQFVVTFAEFSIMVNEEHVDLSDSRAEALTSLADDILMAPSGGTVGLKVPARVSW